MWDKVPIKECWARTGRRPIGSKLVDVNKGDRANPDVRSRLVAQEVATYRDDHFFAAAPPLEALRLLLSRTATGRRHGRGGKKVMLVDARKAHLHAEVDREIYVCLPPEEHEEVFCARLRRCLYGTRDAPARWEDYYSAVLARLGFQRGLGSFCCCRHGSRDLCIVVHGDDFIFSG